MQIQSAFLQQSFEEFYKTNIGFCLCFSTELICLKLMTQKIYLKIKTKHFQTKFLFRKIIKLFSTCFISLEYNSCYTTLYGGYYKVE